MMLGRLTGHGVPPHARHTAHTTARAAAVYNLVFLLCINYNRRLKIVRSYGLT